jgi:hypothetical protein
VHVDGSGAAPPSTRYGLDEPNRRCAIEDPMKVSRRRKVVMMGEAVGGASQGPAARVLCEASLIVRRDVPDADERSHGRSRL